MRFSSPRALRLRAAAARHDPAAAGPQGAADSRAYVRSVALAHAESLRRAAEETVPALPDEWFAAAVFSDFTLRLAPHELDAMKGEVAAVIERYRTRPSEAADAADVSVRLQAFPLTQGAEGGASAGAEQGGASARAEPGGASAGAEQGGVSAGAEPGGASAVRRPPDSSCSPTSASGAPRHSAGSCRPSVSAAPRPAWRSP
ncbi:hypothetical protein [Streptomyces flavofungini]|uniref:hypothetical protein n=1 Tax=Streptomyces flavofungini TaxID=68200 RepID=UPI0025B14FD4|nr:hypothetical protein [Streptomyces flavofungini]WJV44790.1 hypothetical protein QUY26_04145 [Streptomyces flavofungini]